MNIPYTDIRKRIDDPILWFDENAVPRYDPFHPRLINTYADEAVLYQIACQDCGTRFMVAESDGSIKRMLAKRSVMKHDYLADDIRGKRLHYGDPPNIGCCPAGPTMNSEFIGIIEYWVCKDFEWQRDPTLEELKR